jgi:hypothetical protein
MSFLDQLRHSTPLWLPPLLRRREFDDGYGVEGFGGQPNANSAPIWTPANLGGLFYWHEAAIGYDFTDTARTAAANVNDTVGSETDRSSSGNHVSQATVADRPQLVQVTNGGATFYDLAFDGTDDYLQHPTPANGAAGVLFGCFGFRAADTVNVRTPFLYGNEASNAALYAVTRNNNLGMEQWGGNAVSFFNGTTGNMVAGTYYVASFVYDGTNLTTYLNGVQSNQAARALSLAANLLYVGAIPEVATYWNGNLPILLLTNTLPSSADHANARAYIGNKIGVATL